MSKKPCELCRHGVPNRGRRHGYHLRGVGMVDTVCPISADELTDLERTLLEIITGEPQPEPEKVH